MSHTGTVLRNEHNVTEEDLRRYHLAHFQAACLFWYTDPSSLLTGGIDPASCVVRLPDSVENGRIKGWEEYEEECFSWIEYWYRRGYKVFQLDNEPDLTWPSFHKEDYTTYGAGDWAAFMDDVLTHLLLSLCTASMGDVVLLMTPFSHPSLKTEWYEMAELHHLPSRCQGAAAHCYWQASGDMQAGWAGKEYEWVHQRTGLDVYITEAGNSSCQETNPPTPEQIENLMCIQYPQYVQQVEGADYVKGLFFYILGSKGWAGFELTEKVCQAIGAVLPQQAPLQTGAGALRAI